MNLKYLILLMEFGLGAFLFTFNLSGAVPDPYFRYLASVRNNRPESSESHFAGECGIDLSHTPARFAVSAGGPYKVVHNLSAGLKTLEADFYTSAEVHWSDKKGLIVLWPNDDAEGVDVRQLLCYKGDRLEKAEVIYWDIPQDPDHRGGIWGYRRRWERGLDEKLLVVNKDFINISGRQIQKPKLDADQQKYLQWTPEFDRLFKLKLPTTLFR